jgi:hypothetical protein
MAKIRDAKSVFTGTFLVLVAILGFYLVYPLSNFTEVGLGPGFTPRAFAAIQLAIGAAVIASGFVRNGEPTEPWQFRPLLIIVAIIFFGLAIETMGLAIALFGLVLIACSANRGTKLTEALYLAAGTVVFSIIVFVKALGLSIPLWPSLILGS